MVLGADKGYQQKRGGQTGRGSRNLYGKGKEVYRENFQKDLTLDEVSKIVDISPYYFSKLFKQETGENFIEYLTKIQNEKCRQLLKDSSILLKKSAACPDTVIPIISAGSLNVMRE